MDSPLFRDRAYAGRLLAQRLMALAGNRSVVVLGLARGGVPVAHEIAAALQAPLDVFVVRKLGVPGHEEIAMGAIAPADVRVLNPEVISALSIDPRTLEQVTQREQQELVRRISAYRHGPAPVLRGATVVLVDDGVATGASMQAAVLAARKLGAAAVIVAAPVMSREAFRLFSSFADRCECLVAPESFGSVGAYYADFSQLSDADVRLLLSSRQNGGIAATTRVTAAHSSATAARIPVHGAELVADIVVPLNARGIVIFAHGSGSSRRSKRNRQVAAAMNARGFATCLLDLLSEDEERGAVELRFDVELLASRLVRVTDWLGARAETHGLAVGYFGASTGAAAALIAAAQRAGVVRAVVSRGGRPDLAGDALTLVRAPTLLIVGGNDFEVLLLNRTARRYLHAARETEIAVVAGATHLFEEPGALDEVAQLAAAWFEAYLVQEPAATVAG